MLSRLVAHGKQLFLITNSPFSFVDKGMRHMVGPDWRQLFDVVIVQADKPSFFTDRRKPFRKLDEKGSLHWDRITRLEKGKIYRQVRASWVGAAPHPLGLCLLPGAPAPMLGLTVPCSPHMCREALQ